MKKDKNPLYGVEYETDGERRLKNGRLWLHGRLIVRVVSHCLFVGQVMSPQSSFFDRIVQMFLDGFFKYLRLLLCLLVVKVLSLVTLFNPLKSQKYLVSLCCVLKTLVVSDWLIFIDEGPPHFICMSTINTFNLKLTWGLGSNLDILDIWIFWIFGK